jgi:hypothetical protein
MVFDLKGMTREEKIKAMHALWEDLAREEDGVVSPPWHGEALRETSERVRDGVEGVRSWAEAKQELRRRIS